MDEPAKVGGDGKGKCYIVCREENLVQYRGFRVLPWHLSQLAFPDGRNGATCPRNQLPSKRKIRRVCISELGNVHCLTKC